MPERKSARTLPRDGRIEKWIRWPPTVVSPAVAPVRSRNWWMHDRSTRARGLVAHNGQTANAPVICVAPAAAPAMACL
jgi:hypothetical protein